VELYLIRHTRPLVASGVCYGQTDLALAEGYSDALTKLKSIFTELNIAHIYTSPLQRCRHLAQDLFCENAIVDKRLMEINFGEWEMSAWDNIPKQELDRWADDLVHFRPPQGENLFDLDHRVEDFYQELSRQHAQGDKIVIVCHAGVIRCLLSRLMSMPLSAHLNWQIDYGSVSKIVVETQFVRLCYTNM